MARPSGAREGAARSDGRAGGAVVPGAPGAVSGGMLALTYVACLLTGVLNAVHSGTNAQLTKSLARPWWSAVIVCAISGVVVLAGVVVTRESFPGTSSLAATPWWAWVGTAIAAIAVIATLFFAGRLGGATYNGLVVTATLVASIALDHYGLLGFAVRPATLLRMVGGAIMLGGLAMVCVF